MAEKAPSAGNGRNQDSIAAECAFAVHAAYMQYERKQPDIMNNPHWCSLKIDAFNAFIEALKDVA